MVHGVGMRLEVDEHGGYTVQEVLKGGGAGQCAKVQAGDLVIAIEGNVVKGLSYSAIVGWMVGREGTSVRVTLSRGGGATFDAKMKRVPMTRDESEEVMRGVSAEHEALARLVEAKDMLLVEKSLLMIDMAQLQRRV